MSATTDPRILVSEVDGLRRYKPELLENAYGEMVWTQECAELVEGRWESFITIPAAEGFIDGKYEITP